MSWDSPRRLQRILVVDDQRPLLRALATTLEGAGFQVFAAESGREATSIASEHQLDLLITDLGMPDEDGFELARRMKKEHPELKIIVMSGTFGPDLLKAARLLGADATLSKPMTATALLDCIRKLDTVTESDQRPKQA
jgi:DNA-binding response OmpR family regulator